MKALLFATILAGCVTDPTAPELELEFPASAARRLYLHAPFDCGPTISHPCPWLVFTTLDVDVVAGTATWTPIPDATAVDLNGFPADHRPSLVEPIVIDSATGRPALSQRGDDGGLRLEAVIDADLGGDVIWDLFNVPGATTFHLESTP